MDILILGGTRFFGKYTVEQLVTNGYDVTIATRGISSDNFGNRVQRIIYDRTSTDSIYENFSGKFYDVIIDKIAYSSNDVKRILDTVQCGKYILMSSTAVYETLHYNTTETDFTPFNKKLIWCDRADFDYGEVKRQAECAVAQAYNGINSIFVRYPVVLSKDDYTKRLYFYVEHIMTNQPMYIDNIDCQMSFINSEEAGNFMAYLVDTDYIGAVNGASDGTVSVREIIEYVEKETGKKAIISENADNAPYNSTPSFSISTLEAKSIGYVFSNINDWIYELLDFYIKQYKQ